MNIKLIIGLGNPDPQYAATYHNIGFLFIDFLNKKSANYQLPPLRHQQTDSDGQAITNCQLLKSDAFMNESGAFVARTMKEKKIALTELLIVHDDSDLKIGNYKLSFNRNSAGHKGAANVIAILNTKMFWRLRIGIRPGNERGRQKAEALVLKKISAADHEILQQEFATIAEQLQGKEQRAKSKDTN